MVVTRPSVLGLSFEANLDPKLGFLQAELGFTAEKLRERVLRLPAILTYSLPNRYRPRLQACRAVGASPSVLLHRITQSDARFYPSIGLTDWDEFVPSRDA